MDPLEAPGIVLDPWTRRVSRPGVPLALLLAAASFGVMAVHRSSFGGSDLLWRSELFAWGVQVAATVATASVRDSFVALALLIAQAALAFLGNLSEAAFLPARYLQFGSLAVLLVTVLPESWHSAGGLVLAGEFLLMERVFEGMTVPVPPWTTSMAVVVTATLGASLLRRVQRSGRELQFLRDANEELHAAVHQLTAANTEFLEQANTASEESAVSERSRITRELHDVVGQTLTNIIMMMDATLHRNVHEPVETAKLLRWIRSQAKDGLQETRAVLYELRALRPQNLRGLWLLKRMIDTFSRLSRLQVHVEWGNLPWTFHREQEIAVYHVIQQALSNAFRHGTAARVDIHFQVEEGTLNLMIRDDGKGGPDSQPGIGQRGMEERLERWGGTVAFRSEVLGYTVLATLPLLEEDNEPVPHLDR